MIARDIANLISFLALLKRGAPVFLRGLGNRASLAAVEIEDAWRTSVVMLVIMGFAFGLACLSLVAGTFLVAAIFWDTSYRVTALAVLMGLELAGAVAAILWVRACWKSWEPFQVLREQLNKDSECLEEIFPPQEN